MSKRTPSKLINCNSYYNSLNPYFSECPINRFGRCVSETSCKCCRVPTLQSSEQIILHKFSRTGINAAHLQSFALKPRWHLKSHGQNSCPLHRNRVQPQLEQQQLMNRSYGNQDKSQLKPHNYQHSDSKISIQSTQTTNTTKRHYSKTKINLVTDTLDNDTSSSQFSCKIDESLQALQSSSQDNIMQCSLPIFEVLPQLQVTDKASLNDEVRNSQNLLYQNAYMLDGLNFDYNAKETNKRERRTRIQLNYEKLWNSCKLIKLYLIRKMFAF